MSTFGPSSFLGGGIFDRNPVIAQPFQLGRNSGNLANDGPNGSVQGVWPFSLISYKFPLQKATD